MPSLEEQAQEETFDLFPVSEACRRFLSGAKLDADRNKVHLLKMATVWQASQSRFKWLCQRIMQHAVDRQKIIDELWLTRPGSARLAHFLLSHSPAALPLRELSEIVGHLSEAEVLQLPAAKMTTDLSSAHPNVLLLLRGPMADATSLRNYLMKALLESRDISQMNPHIHAFCNCCWDEKEAPAFLERLLARNPPLALQILRRVTIGSEWIKRNWASLLPHLDDGLVKRNSALMIPLLKEAFAQKGVTPANKERYLSLLSSATDAEFFEGLLGKETADPILKIALKSLVTVAPQSDILNKAVASGISGPKRAVFVHGISDANCNRYQAALEGIVTKAKECATIDSALELAQALYLTRTLKLNLPISSWIKFGGILSDRWLEQEIVLNALAEWLCIYDCSEHSSAFTHAILAVLQRANLAAKQCVLREAPKFSLALVKALVVEMNTLPQSHLIHKQLAQRMAIGPHRDELFMLNPPFLKPKSVSALLPRCLDDTQRLAQLSSIDPLTVHQAVIQQLGSFKPLSELEQQIFFATDASQPVVNVHTIHRKLEKGGKTEKQAIEAQLKEESQIRQGIQSQLDLISKHLQRLKAIKPMADGLSDLVPLYDLLADPVYRPAIAPLLYVSGYPSFS